MSTAMSTAMRTHWIAAVALLCAGFVSSPLRAETEDFSGQGRAEAAGRALVGSPAPSFALKTIDGEVIDLGKLYGKKAVYLKFWETWCQPCREQMPHFQRTHETAGADLAVIAVDTGINDPLEDIQKFRRKAGMTMPIVIDDGRLAEAFNLRVTPQHVVIGRDGRIQYMGHLADERLEVALRTARTSSAPSHGLSSVIPTGIAQSGVGDPLPNLSAKTLDGGVFHARDAAAKKPTVLVFFSPWCESYLAESRPQVATRCRQVREQVDEIAKGNTAVRWLGVASSLWATQGDLQGYLQQHKISIPLMLDESGLWFRSFGVLNVPTLLIADAQGQLIRRVEGFNPDLPTQLQGMMKK